MSLSTDPKLVENLSCTSALNKYQPRLVVASWILHNTRTGFDILDFPSVDFFIDIGEVKGGATWLTDDVYRRTD